MDIKNFRKGIYNGRVLLQQSGEIGGLRQVFVKLQGSKNELVFPTFGCRLMNPFKGHAKFFAGDLVEYRMDGTGFILKTYEVADDVANNATTVYIVRNGYRHIPFVGDVLMVAPDALGGTGKAVTVSAVTATTATIGGHSVDVWQLTISANFGAAVSKGAILVEAVEAGASKAMLVSNPNMFLPWDLECIFDPAATGVSGDDDYEKAKYMFSPIIEAVAYIHKMSPLPECVKALNGSRVTGWFALNALQGNGASAAMTNFYTKSAADAKFAEKADSLEGYGITDAYTKDAADEKFAEKATTLAGYGITDASINTGTRTVTLGENSIVVPSE